MITDNNGKTYMPKIIQNGKVKRFTLGKNTVSAGVEYIEFTDSDFCASSGEDGYYTVADVNKQGSYLCRFDKKEDQEVILKQNLMPISGIKKENYTALIIAVGMKNCFYVRIGVKDKKTKEKVKAYGGRPSFYFNVDFYNFDKNDEARRKKDLLCDTDENLRYSVSKIKEAYEEFKEQRHLQLEFMEKYIFEENGTRTEYSDGSVCEILQ